MACALLTHTHSTGPTSVSANANCSNFGSGICEQWKATLASVDKQSFRRVRGLVTVLLLLADVGARLLIAPAELPLGIITALLGAPFFLALLMRAQRRGGV